LEEYSKNETDNLVINHALSQKVSGKFRKVFKKFPALLVRLVAHRKYSRKYSENIQKIFRKYSDNIQKVSD